MQPVTIPEFVELASRLGVPACDLLRFVQEFSRGDVERIGDREERINGKVPLG